jgi:hypothetical protein
MSGLVIVAVGIVMMVALAPLDLATALVGGIAVCAAGIAVTWIKLS